MDRKPLNQGEQPRSVTNISFSTALRIIEDRLSRLAEEGKQLLDWKGANDGRNATRIRYRPKPSPVDLFLQDCAENVEDMVSLEKISYVYRGRLSDMICNLRKMDIHVFELFVKGSPKVIPIKDCSWLPEEQFLRTFENLDAKRLKVLELEHCRQFAVDKALRKTLTWRSNSLPKLGVISLKGACQLSNEGLKALVISAPALYSVNLSQCAHLTHVGINTLAMHLGSTLKELYLNDCPKIDAWAILPALKKFKRLEVLSVAGIETVCNLFLHGLLTKSGNNIKKLDISNCRLLNNLTLINMGNRCKGLHSLNISNLNKLTRLGLEGLAEGCRSIKELKLGRNNFSDKAIAAFLETCGESLEQLSLNSVTRVDSCTAFSLAKCSRKLSILDLSWCKNITDQALGLIVDRCSSLKLLKLFGCTQITNVFLNGHSNRNVRIVGLQPRSMHETISLLEPSEVDYSVLNSSSD